MHRIGWVEHGVREDLRAMPDRLRRGALARTALWLAEVLDAGEMLPRDAITAAAQLRQCMVQLAEWAPGADESDDTDEKREKRELRLLRPAE